MCERAKLHKVARVDHKDKQPNKCWQHFQIDYGFFVQKSTGHNKTLAPPKPAKLKKKGTTSAKKLAQTKKSAIQRKVMALFNQDIAAQSFNDNAPLWYDIEVAPPCPVVDCIAPCWSSRL